MLFWYGEDTQTKATASKPKSIPIVSTKQKPKEPKSMYRSFIDTITKAGLGHLLLQLREQEIYSFDDLIECDPSDDELLDDFGIKNPQHRRSLLSLLNKQNKRKNENQDNDQRKRRHKYTRLTNKKRQISVWDFTKYDGICSSTIASTVKYNNIKKRYKTK